MWTLNIHRHEGQLLMWRYSDPLLPSFSKGRPTEEMAYPLSQSQSQQQGCHDWQRPLNWPQETKCKYPPDRFQGRLQEPMASKLLMMRVYCWCICLIVCAIPLYSRSWRGYGTIWATQQINVPLFRLFLKSQPFGFNGGTYRFAPHTPRCTTVPLSES